MSLLANLANRIRPRAIVNAHCDVPCGIYDPHDALQAAQTCIRMTERTTATVVGNAFVIELDFLKGRERLVPYEVFSLIHYDGED